MKMIDKDITDQIENENNFLMNNTEEDFPLNENNKNVSFCFFQEGDLFTKDDHYDDNLNLKKESKATNCSTFPESLLLKQDLEEEEEYHPSKLVEKGNSENVRNNELDDILNDFIIFPSCEEETIEINNNTEQNIENNFNNNTNLNEEQLSHQKEEERDYIKQQLINKQPPEIKERQMILENLIPFAKDQKFCRLLQQKIISNPSLATFFFPTILENINDLIIHPYGNYLIQNILIHISDNQINNLLIAIKDEFSSICTNFYGTRVIQKLVLCIHSDIPMINLLNIIKNNFPSIINNINSSHIISNLLLLNILEIRSSIYNMIILNINLIATDKHGCCSIQKIIENDLMFTNNIVICLINNSLQLITHQYANYTIQFVLQMKNPIYTKQLIDNLLPHFGELAKQKYSSPVLEKCFELCEGKTRKELYKVISHPPMIKMLICDKFGNYVIQKAIDNATEKKKMSLLRIIAHTTKLIKKENFGKKLYMRMCTNYPNLEKLSKSNKRKGNE